MSSPEPDDPGPPIFRYPPRRVRTPSPEPEADAEPVPNDPAHPLVKKDIKIESESEEEEEEEDEEEDEEDEEEDEEEEDEESRKAEHERREMLRRFNEQDWAEADIWYANYMRERGNRLDEEENEELEDEDEEDEEEEEGSEGSMSPVTPSEEEDEDNEEIEEKKQKDLEKSAKDAHGDNNNKVVGLKEEQANSEETKKIDKDDETARKANKRKASEDQSLVNEEGPEAKIGKHEKADQSPAELPSKIQSMEISKEDLLGEKNQQSKDAQAETYQDLEGQSNDDTADVAPTVQKSEKELIAVATNCQTT